MTIDMIKSAGLFIFKDISFVMGASKVFVEAEIKDSFFIDHLENAALDTGFANRLSYHRILLVEKGSGTLVVDNNMFEVAEERLFLLAKGQVYLFEKPSPFSGYVLSFGDCFWEKTPASASNCKAVLFNNAAANQCLRLNEAELSELLFLFKTLLGEFKKPHYINQIDALAAFLKIIMIKVANIRITEESAVDSQDYKLYRDFMNLLGSRFKTHHEVNDYARILDITARRLSDLCKRCSNKTAKEIINDQLVAEAKRSLQFSSTPVKEIAYELNFNSPEEFSHFFKKNTNFSPANYRDQFVNIGA